ncbi:MAG TPA: CHAD domain-containing protein [Hypericibacter adhaerens]|jgi:inorganic triphosphatase YgiF|uniref:Inorganic triphosphatase n=1 Tax=Hypericibacter adhaerens TaxID=2602016 RepID=A0A5J6N2F5_9PROT|nr:CYTH and CHAD domain-containing protein [Hypericibacter adhaerens]QEX23133.1 inorganic triphosphatase [Hypericibacter adhaerens]HWA45031.1 CHAD domain-containing protein [Hypericibacter adhaerens]
MAEEIELKLALAPELVGALRRDPTLKAQALKRPVTRRLFSVYYDTPELELSQAGMALRVRRVGQRFVQTLKVAGAAGGGLHQYAEHEQPLASERPDLASIAEPALKRFLAKKKIAHRLVPVFSTEIKRRVWLLGVGGAEIEVALDEGEIQSGGQRLAITELELELKLGATEAVYDLAIDLAQRWPFRIEWQTKAARGYRLFLGAEQEARRGSPIAIERGATAQSAFGDIARACLAQFGANEAVVERGEDPEGVHQARVALRRMRALVAAYRHYMANDVHGWLSQELRWLQQELSPARDWDVFVGYTLPPILRRLPEDLALQHLQGEAEAVRRAAYDTVRALFASPRYTLLLLKVGRLIEAGDWKAPAGTSEAATLDEPIKRFADRLLAFRQRRLKKFAKKRESLSESELHRLRLLAKKLRYSADFFRSLYAQKPVRRFYAAIAELQDRLGSINDAVVTHGLLQKLEPRMPDSAEAAHAIGLVRGWQAAKIDQDLIGFAQVWKDFSAAKPFWGKPREPAKPAGAE